MKKKHTPDLPHFAFLSSLFGLIRSIIYYKIERSSRTGPESIKVNGVSHLLK